MYAQIVRLQVKPDSIDAFREVFRSNYEGSRKEVGNIRFELLQSSENPAHFTVYEVFVSAEALAFHRQTEHYKKCTARYDDLLEGERVIEVMKPAIADYL